MLYELARTRLGLYVVGRKSCLLTVMMLIIREGDECLSRDTTED